MIRDTSIAVYHQIKQEGLLSKRRLQVYECLYENGPMSQSECCREIDARMDSIKPRFAELNEMGIIIEVGKRPCEVTNREVLIWDVTSKLPIKPEKKKTFTEKKKEILENIIKFGNTLPEHYRKDLRNIYWKLKEL